MHSLLTYRLPIQSGDGDNGKKKNPKKIVSPALESGGGGGGIVHRLVPHFSEHSCVV